MTAESMSRYVRPQQWMRYEPASIMDALIAAKTAAGILSGLPYLPQWIAQVHEEQLRLEAVGTSRIEGAEFNQREQEEALAPASAMRSDLTHSQRQLRAAESAYRWLREQPAQRPVNEMFILDVHRRIVTGCDDDNCEPGAVRPDGWNVTFGSPRCRGVEGGGRDGGDFWIPRSFPLISIHLSRAFGQDVEVNGGGEDGFGGDIWWFCGPVRVFGGGVLGSRCDGHNQDVWD